MGQRSYGDRFVLLLRLEGLQILGKLSIEFILRNMIFPFPPLPFSLFLLSYLILYPNIRSSIAIGVIIINKPGSVGHPLPTTKQSSTKIGRFNHKRLEDLPTPPNIVVFFRFRYWYQIGTLLSQYRINLKGISIFPTKNLFSIHFYALFKATMHLPYHLLLSSKRYYQQTNRRS